jgi:hypothetical protein
MKTKDIAQALSMSPTTVYAAIKAADEGAGIRALAPKPSRRQLGQKATAHSRARATHSALDL